MESATVIRQLCLACGLCCNGVLFKDVELQPADSSRIASLKNAGLTIRSRSAAGQSAAKQTCPQPCPALASDGCCQVYADRPARCREFECALFKATAAGTTPVDAALKRIRLAHRRADRVRRLFQAVGDTHESLPLGLRFQRLQRRFNRGDFDEQATSAYSELTLAMHALNVQLSTEFYPGDQR